MTATLWSPHLPELQAYNADILTSVPLFTSLDDVARTSSDASSSLSLVDVVLPQLSTFHTSSASDSVGPQHVLQDEQQVHRSPADDTAWSKTLSGGGDIRLSVAEEAASSSGDQLINASDDVDLCLLHLLMTSQPGCHCNHDSASADWRSELSAVSLLADQQCGVERLHQATSGLLGDNEHCLTATHAGDVRSSTFTYDASDSDEERQSKRSVHLWQFLKELLMCPNSYQNAIRWLDRHKGIFKIEDSACVARLWGKRKNRPAMNYDKLSRSIRQYYRKGIIRKTDCSRRLVYQFCPKYL